VGLPSTLAASVLPTRYGPGPLVDRRRHRRDLVGQICPQPRTGTVLLDDVLGTGWALLTDGLVDAAPAERARRRAARVVQIEGLADAEPLRCRLQHGRAAGVLLRPDRVTLATAPQQR
jgi:hypothetical protein